MLERRDQAGAGEQAGDLEVGPKRLPPDPEHDEGHGCRYGEVDRIGRAGLGAEKAQRREDRGNDHQDFVASRKRVAREPERSEERDPGIKAGDGEASRGEDHRGERCRGKGSPMAAEQEGERHEDAELRLEREQADPEPGAPLAPVEIEREEPEQCGGEEARLAGREHAVGEGRRKQQQDRHRSRHEPPHHGTEQAGCRQGP